MTTALFPLLAVPIFLLLAVGLYFLAKLEIRAAGRSTLVPTLVVGLFAGALFLFLLNDGMVSDRREETVRRLFHLPDDVAVGRIHGGERDSACFKTSIQRRASVQFTPAQFQAYVASIHDRANWRPVRPPHYIAGKSQFQYAEYALVWRELPAPPWQGKQQLVWRIAGADVRRGLAQCYEFTKMDDPASGLATGSKVAYAVTACNPRARPVTPVGGGRVTAALDFDKQRLNLAYQFDSKPEYCNNRVTNWMSDVFGLKPS